MAKKTYMEAAHAMQTGVAMKMKYEAGETSPKHLRVGVNSAMVETSAIVKLLINKGLITMEEFQVELAQQMNDEADRYETELKNITGGNIVLH